MAVFLVVQEQITSWLLLYSHVRQKSLSLHLMDPTNLFLGSTRLGMGK